MNLKKQFPIITRNLHSLAKEKTFLLIVFLLLFIIVTMGILLSVIVILFNPQYLVTENVIIGTLTTENIPEELLDIYKFDYKTYNSTNEALLAYNRSEIDALITIQQTRETVESPLILQITIPEDPLKQSLILSLLKPELDTLEATYQKQRDAIPGAVWQSDIRFSRQPLLGMNQMYEQILGFMIPLLLLIPVFLIGNLFIDSISQEYEEGNMQLILVATSPLRYINEHIIQAFLINTLFSALFLVLLGLRFPFLQQGFLVFLYITLCVLPIALLSIGFAFFFEKKETAQLSYSFSILALFVLSPFIISGPTQVITTLFLGQSVSVFSFIAPFVIGLLLYLMMWLFMKKKYV